MLLGSSCEYLHKQPICDLVARAAQFAEHNCTKPVSAWLRCCYFHILLKVEVFLNILSLQLTSPSSQQERYKNLNFLVQVILKKTMKMQIDQIQKFTIKFPIFACYIWHTLTRNNWQQGSGGGEAIELHWICNFLKAAALCKCLTF